jgi:AmpD protein
MNDAAFRIGEDGWCENVERVPSPNCDPRPEGAIVDLLVVHNISLPPGQFGEGYIAALFTNQLDCDAHPYFDQLRALRVSAHFLIRRDGAVIQFVSTLDRAWHAGASRFGDREKCNDFSIGIEVEGSDDEPFEPAQYGSLASLTAALHVAHPLRHIAGHEHIAPGRKTDPGPYFDWPQYQKLVTERTASLQTLARSSAPSLPLASTPPPDFP